MDRMSLALLVGVLALNLTSCSRAKRPSVEPTMTLPGATIWQAPTDLATRDLYYGPWGSTHAPDPNAIYTFVKRKHSGVNLGMTVIDPRGREWSVKQGFPSGLDDEAPVEVALSRLLSAIGYYQAPVYYLPRFTLRDDWGTHAEPGGRFRLKEDTLKEVGSWRWEQNPFVGTKPYQGLLVLLTMFNSSDLSTSNNSLYEHRSGGKERIERWYVVRDLGSALGDTNRLAPRKNHPETFERHPFILGVRRGYVDFGNTGWYEALVRERITPDDVAWASSLLARLSNRQWRDAFRGGGYESEVGDRFIRKLREKVRQGQEISRQSTR